MVYFDEIAISDVRAMCLTEPDRNSQSRLCLPGGDKREEENGVPPLLI